ncbi:MAG: type I glyceraldehyde-3-phosphate dehydrogenase [Minisyncoccia bacterium]
MKVAINGFGRIGRTFLRQSLDYPQIEIVAINDLSDVNNLAYLLKHDSVYREFSAEVEVKIVGDKNYLVVNGQNILVIQEKDPINLPWGDLDVDVVVEATGVFDSYDKASAHIQAGAKRVVITAPVKKDDLKVKTVLLGINEKDLALTNVTSNGSCTTNALAPLAQILSDKIGIKKAILNTVHAYTATQKIVDGIDSKDWRRGRAGADNIVPSTTGAAISVAQVVTSLDNKFDGLSVRVPVISGSLIDFTFISQKQTSVEEINEVLVSASQSNDWKGIIEVTNEPLVSSDILGNICPCLVDLGLTKVVDGDLVKVMAWYDNEWGYTWTLLKHVIKLEPYLK